MSKQHRILAIDEGLQQMSLIDTGTAVPPWTISLADYPLARDMQRLDAERVLVGYDQGFCVLDIASGAIKDVCARWTGVTAVHRRADGATLVTGFDLDGLGGINVLTLDAELNVVHAARRDGDYVRLMRPTPHNTYLLCSNDHILETTPDLVALRSFAAPGFEHAWKAERGADGSTLVSAGYGAFMALFDTAGVLIQRFGGAAALPPEVVPFFYASYERLADGGLLVANWQGHGPDNGRKGQQLLEFNAGGELEASWSLGHVISSLQGILRV